MTFNKWNYTNANPVNLTDPTGYGPIEECVLLWGLATYTPANFLRYKLQISSFDYNGACIVQKIMDPAPGNSLQTYTAAGLAIESNFYRGWIEGTRGSLYARFVKPPDYWGSGLGICNISDADMETAWGEPVMRNGEQYGGDLGHLGLGYKGLDQEDLDIAVMAMRSKIGRA